VFVQIISAFNFECFYATK